MSAVGSIVGKALALALAGVIVAAVGYYLVSGSFSEQFASTLRENASSADRHHSEPQRQPKDSGQGRGEAVRPRGAEEVVESVGAAAATVWDVARGMALVGLVAGGTFAGMRLYRRREQGCQAFLVVPYEGEMGSSGSITDTWEQIHQALAELWWRRAWRGQPPITVGLVSERAEKTGALRFRIFILMPPDPAVQEGVEAALRGTYENVRLERFSLHANLRHIVRLKRDLPFWRGRLPTPVISADGEHEQREFVVDRVLTAMEQAQEPAIVAMTVWPTPGLFERFAHALLRRREAETSDEDDLIPRSAVRREEIEGAAEGFAHRPLFFGEIRVGAGEQRIAHQLAAVIQGSSRRGEGKLIRHNVNARRGVYQDRVARGLGNPVPSWSHGVYSTAEMAALWRLPKSFRSAGRIETHPMPRLLPPPAMRRVPASEGIVLAERGVERGVERGLALWPPDLRANMGVLGTIEAGKTTALVRMALNLATDPNRMLVFIDPKGDGWKRLLAALETERPVYIIDCSAPELGFSPLVGSLDTQKRVSAMLASLQEMYRVDGQNVQMYARSLAAFKIFAESAIELLPDPRFDDLADFLSVTDEGYAAREWLRNQIAETGRAIHLLDEIRELEQQLKDAKAAFTQNLASPRNKITNLRMEPMISVLHHPAQLDLKRAMDERAIVVVNGAEGVLDMEPMRGLLTMFLVMVASTVLSQQELPEDERADVSLILDEAHFFLGNEYFKDSLATARSAGLSSVLAFQTLGQLAREDQLRSLTSLVRNWLFFRISPDDARDVMNLLQQTHIDQVRTDDDALDRILANPRALSAARQFWALGTWVVNGDPSPAFTCMVEPVPGVPERVDIYRHQQRAQTGAHALRRGEHRPPGRPWQTDAKAVGTTADERLVQAPEQSDPPAERAPNNGGPRSSDANGGARTPSRPQPTPAREPDAAAASETPPARQAPPTGPRRASPAAATAKPAQRARKVAPSERPEGATPDVGAAQPIPAKLSRTAPQMEMLDRYDSPTGIREEERKQAASPRPARGQKRWEIIDGTRQPNAVQLQVLRALFSYRVMAQFQIAERFFDSDRSAHRAMSGLYEMGLVEAFVVTTRSRGRDPKLYRLSRAGFELGKLVADRHGKYVPADADWDRFSGNRERAAPRLAHDIEAVSWALAFEDLARPCLRQVRGEHQCYALPPRTGPIPKDRSAPKPPAKRPHQVRGAGKHSFLSLDAEFTAVHPDVGFELEVDVDREVLRFDLLVEYERNPKSRDKLVPRVQGIDAMATCWHREHPRYRELGPPVVLFVCPSPEEAARYATIADAVLLGSVARDGDRPDEREYTGRKRIFFTAVSFAYQRSLLAYKVPEYPPEQRGRAARNKAERRAQQEPQVGPVVELLPPRVLERPLRIPR